jgi:uncharacterized protein
MKHPQKELDKLDHFFQKQYRNADAMELSEFDGFCAALIVCPEMIMPSEWLPIVLGQEGGIDEDTVDLETGVALIMKHYNRVAEFLTPPSETYETIYGSDPNSGDVYWEPWVGGFGRAMKIRPKAWEKIMSCGDKNLIEGLTMLLLMQVVCAGEVDLLDNEFEDMDKNAPDSIPNIVLDLNEWTKSQQQQEFPFASQAPANANIEPFGSVKVGRNDPCPCGSGKKYKKCCG